MKETFHISKAWKIKLFFNCGWPVIFLLIILVKWIFLVLPSQGSRWIVYNYEWWTPLLVFGLFIWFFYEFQKALKDHKFSITVSENGIQVGEVSKSWSEIKRAEIKFALGRDPAIILYANSGECINIPAMIDGRGYIEGVIERYIKEVLKPQK